jgi:hypothetical protein
VPRILSKSGDELSLRGTCHFLLALASFFEVCHQVNHFVYFYNVTLGPKFIDYYLCIKIMTIPTLGSNALQITLLGTAIDRLLSIKAPILWDFFLLYIPHQLCNQNIIISYKNNNDSMRQKFLYLGAFCTVIFGYGIYSAGYFLINAAKYKGINVLCDISDTFLAEMYNYYVYNTFVLDIITATLYVFVWKAIRKNVQGLASLLLCT